MILHSSPPGWTIATQSVWSWRQRLQEKYSFSTTWWPTSQEAMLKTAEQLTSVLHNFHWVPVHYQICFMVVVLVFKDLLVCLRNHSFFSAVLYLLWLSCILWLRETKETIARILSAHGHKLWNYLSLEIGINPSLVKFWKWCKTHLLMKTFRKELSRRKTWLPSYERL